MTPSLISCIVPVFNGEIYLAEALGSILNQTYGPLEIIVADDGSTDGTAALASRHSARVRYVWQPNSGAAAARNLGLTAAKGEFVAFLDADDLWHPDKLTRQSNCFQDHPELDLCVTHLQNFWIPELENEKQRFQGHRLAEVLPGYLTSTLLARRAFFDRIGRFDPAFRLGDGTDWFLRAAECGAVMELLPDVLLYRRIHQANISMEPGSRNMTAPMRNAQLQAVKASLDRRRQQSDGRPVSLKFPMSPVREPRTK